MKKVKARQIQRKLLEQSRAEEEEKLRALAARARQQRVANGNKDSITGLPILKNESKYGESEARERIES